jgi:hypothetical protein
MVLHLKANYELSVEERAIGITVTAVMRFAGQRLPRRRESTVLAA